MTLALQAQPGSLAATGLLSRLLERVEDWSDPLSMASAVALALREQLRHPVVRIFGCEAGRDTLRLLASAPPGESGMAPGTRLPPGKGALGEAVRTGSMQSTVDAYVEPDFVRSLPGDTRSELAVPVRRGGAVLGAVLLEYPSPHRSGPDAGPLVELLVRPLAVALEIETARAAATHEDGRLERRLRWARTAASVAERLARADDVAGVLRRVVEGALELVPGRAALLLLRHRERQALEVAAAAGVSPFAAGVLIPLDGTIPGAVLAHARPVVADGLGEAAEGFSDDDGALGIRDALAVPLLSAGRAYGVLAVLNRASRAASAEDVELLQGIADQAAAVEALRQVGPLRQQISDASTIAEVGRAMTGTLGLEEVLTSVVQAAQMLLDGRSAAVGLLSGTGELTLVSATGTLRASRGTTVPLERSLLGWVVRHGEPVITPSVSDDPRGTPHEVRQGPGVVVPLEARGQILGALLVARREGAAELGEADLDALRKLGAYAAIAIDNARLYQAQADLSLALRTQASELERAYSELRSSQQRLVVSEKMAALGRVTAGIAHEINSPLASILYCLRLGIGYAREYQASLGDPEVTVEDHRGIAGDLLDSLVLAEGAARRVAQFVRTIKDQTRLGEETIASFDPVVEVENTIAYLQHELRNREVAIRVEAGPGLRLTGDPTKFAVVVQNLLSNAVDAMEGAAGEIRVGLRRGRGGMVLEVEDHGCGIPEEIRPRIFDYLFTTKDIGRGTGLGLSMVHSIVTSSFRGEIDLRSEMGAGTTFVIRFPESAETA